jgi:hypothetical protein
LALYLYLPEDTRVVSYTYRKLRPFPNSWSFQIWMKLSHSGFIAGRKVNFVTISIVYVLVVTLVLNGVVGHQ